MKNLFEIKNIVEYQTLPDFSIVEPPKDTVAGEGIHLLGKTDNTLFYNNWLSINTNGVAAAKIIVLYLQQRIGLKIKSYEVSWDSKKKTDYLMLKLEI